MDIDIDTANPKLAKQVLNCIPASMIDKKELKPHLVGVYFQKMATDPLTGLAAIPYDLAEENGYYKFDILHLKFLEYFDNKNEMRHLLKREPDWSMLTDDKVIMKLFHLSSHGDILKEVKPTNIEELADVLALIRPNKIKLLDKYILDKENTRIKLYEKNAASDLRKSHAISYALIIVLQLHLLKAGII